MQIVNQTAFIISSSNCRTKLQFIRIKQNLFTSADQLRRQLMKMIR